jgi:ABC-2 type transport system permease protein
VALIASRLKNKSVVTVLIVVIVLAAYYFVCFRANEIMTSLIENTDKVGRAFGSWLYPVGQLGLGATGRAVPTLIFTAISLVLAALCVLILARSFVRLVTTNRGEARIRERKGDKKIRQADGTLLYREIRHYLSSSAYMLNTGLGIPIMIVVAVVALVKMSSLREVLATLTAQMPSADRLFPVLGAAVLCLVVSVNYITAPSVSLEGRNLWIVQSLPVEPFAVLKAKIRLHLLFNVPPVLILSVALAVVFGLSWIHGILMTVLSLLFLWASAEFGLILNLKKPNLNWTNEAIPVKQSMSVFIALFGGWLLAAVMAAPGFLVFQLFDTAWYMGVWILLFLGLCLLMRRWIRKRGAEIFATLG